MMPVDGVDLINGGLQNHIWLVPILEWVNALKELYLAREQKKLAIYEVMGISDIMRGSTNPYETATAQRIKGTMGHPPPPSRPPSLTSPAISCA